MNLGKSVSFQRLKRMGHGLKISLAHIFSKPHGVAIKNDSNVCCHPSSLSTYSENHSELRVLKRSWRFAAKLLGALLMLGTASTALASTYTCGPGGDFQVLDGATQTWDGNPWPASFDPTNLGSLGFNGSCTIENFPGGFGQSTDTLNFQLPDKNALIIFDNVKYDGKMSCTNLAPGVIIWWVNGSVNNISQNCQDFFNSNPVDGIIKDNPPPGYVDSGTGYTLQSVGVPFTYTLTMPVLQYLDPTSPTGYRNGGTDPATLTNVDIYDDLTATGVDLTYLSNQAYLKSGSTLTPLGSLTNLRDPKHLHFKFANIIANYQLVIKVTVVLDNTPTNAPTTTFTNKATWHLNKTVNGTAISWNGNDGQTTPMMIGAPDLTMTKGGDSTTSGSLNLGDWGYFTLDIANKGNTDAWDPTLMDTLPQGSNGGMCDLTPVIDPGAVTVTDSGGALLRTLSNSDYTMSYTGPTGSPACHLQIKFNTANATLKPGEHLKVVYKTKLDANSLVTNVQLFNVAGVTQWFTSNNYDTDPNTNPMQFPLSTTTAYPCTPPTTPLAGVLLPGAPPSEVISATAALDCIDAHTLTTNIQGFTYSKTADNLTINATNVTTAGPGNKIRYNLTLHSLDKYYTNLVFKDDLGNTTLNPTGASYVSGSLSNVQVTLTNSSGNTTAITSITNNTNPTGGTNSQGLLDVSGTIAAPLTVNAGETLTVSFEVTLSSTLADNDQVINQADLYQGTTSLAISDDPNINGQASASAPFTGDPTVLTIHRPQPPTKTILSPTSGQATIGDTVTYQITVPGTPYSVGALDNVIVNDTLDPALELTGYNIGGVDYPASGTGAVSIPVGTINANQQVIVTLKTRVVNQIGVGADTTDTYKSFTNAASFTYTGGDSGLGAATTPITIIEPKLTSSKSVTNLTGATTSSPASAGDTLKYTITLDNSTGTSEAFDTSVTDMLPANVTLVAGSATATIGGNPVTLFNPNPTTLSSGALAWGAQNGGDGSLDIPAGQSLVLTYNVTVNMANGAPITNSATADYTSMNGIVTGERTGAGCPTITAPNDYCTTATVDFPTADPTTLTKSVVSDTYAETPATTPPSLRIGDTVVYSLALKLREGVIDNLVVTDSLPAGMVYDGLVSITPTSGSANFTYTLASQPAAGDTSLTWNFGTLTNAIDYITTDDTLVIEYRARVVDDQVNIPPANNSTLLTNNATLSYTGGDPSTNPNLDSSATIDARQPVITLTKNGAVNGPAVTGNGSSTTPYIVDVVNNTMTFNLQACNTNGLAPAYNMVVIDQLAQELNDTTLTTPSVSIGGTPLVAGTDYTYTAPATRGGQLRFAFSKPIDPNACVNISYTIGFYNDIPLNDTWNNNASVTEYWSLPQPDSNARKYASVTATPVYMSNGSITVPPPSKVIVTPTGDVTSTTATIGDTVTYKLTVPGTPINAALSNVTINDTLDANLVYVSDTQLGGPLVTKTSGAPSLQFTVPQIPAGQQVVIEVTTRVANSASTNAGVTIPNSVSFSYTNAGVTTTNTVTTPTQVTIVEPAIAINKGVAAPAAPKANDILTYTVTLTASGGTAAYDTVLTDTLGAGLQYVSGSTTIGGNPVADPTISGQTLSWTSTVLPSTITSGSTVTITYQAKLDSTVSPGDLICNNASSTWTSLSGVSSYERDGTLSQPYNDYVVSATPACVTVNDNTNFAKAYASDTYSAAPSTIRVGDLVDYTLTLGLQEGTTKNVQVTDNLPPGMAYEGLVSITPASGSANYSYTVVSQPTQGATGAVTWNLGTVTNVADGNPNNDYLVIKYRVRALNNSVLTQTPINTNQTLVNGAVLTYTLANGATATAPTPLGLSNQAIVTLFQPHLSIAKSSNPAAGTTTIDAGQTITYTVDISNSGTAPAYDTVLTDTLPVGLRNATPVTTSISLVDTATNTVIKTFTSPLAPSYSSTTGVATWNFDTGVADAYTIPAGNTLRVVYTATADASLGSGLPLTNTALVTHYYSFDNNAVPLNANVTYRQDYGQTNTSSVTLNSTMPGDLSKINPVGITNVAIGQQFTYTITVPSTPTPTALYDVNITDTLPTGVQLVSVNKLSTWGTWTPTATVSGSTLTITDNTNGIDIPAGQQAEVSVTVVLSNSSTNQTGNTFANSATYSYNQVNSVGPVITTGTVTTSPLTVVGPDQLYMTKSGPTSMIVGTPGTFTLQIDNPTTQAGGPSSRAWDMTIVDKLPNPTPGGMCDTQPVIQSAVISGGTTPRTLVQGTDFSINFVKGTTDCTLTFTGMTQAAALDPGESLLITYQASLDSDNPNGLSLTNYAGVTQWFSQDTAGSGATGQTRTYTGPLDTGTVGTLDNQDAFTFQTASPTLDFVKTVVDTTNGSSTTAAPGDVLHYTITIDNTSNVPLPNFSLLDDLGQSNNAFVSGSLTNLTITGSASTPDISNVNPTGGTNGAGLLDIRNLALTDSTGANHLITISFDITLQPVISNGTWISNQASVVSYGYNLAYSSPSSGVPAAPTRISIGSAPLMKVEKTATDLTGDPNVLMAGDTLRYTITVQNIGTENAINTVITDAIPANATYVANSTKLNGVALGDPSTGVSPLSAGMLIHAPAPEDTTPGFMRADSSGTTANVATITFDVTVNPGTLDGATVSNQAFVNGDGFSGTAFPATPSDDPTTPALNDPTIKTVVKPNGIVYNSISRQPIAGVMLTMVNSATGAELPASCFTDPAQYHQVTGASGYYKFDLNFSQPECPTGTSNYQIKILSVPKDIQLGTSVFVPPTPVDPANPTNLTLPYDVPTCPNDADITTSQCEAQVSATAPQASATDTRYYLYLTLSDAVKPDDSQIFNNHIALDPKFEETLSVTKTSSLVNVTRGQLVPYTITVENKLPGTLTDMAIIDTIPAGFKYVAGSARYTIDGSTTVNNLPKEPQVTQRDLRWDNVTLAPNEKHIIKMLLIVGSGVSEGDFVNRAQVLSLLTPGNNSRIATATVRVVPDPTFDCSDVIGKVFDDANHNGYQDKGEKGLPGVRVVSARGLLITTDSFGRFHVTCAVTPDENRGSNFILKVDERTLPTGYRITTENPRVERATRGKMLKFNFGASIYRVVRLDTANGVFEPGTTEMRTQWKPRLGLLMEELKKAPSILRVSYLAEVESSSLVNARLNALKKQIAKMWSEQHGGYELTIETEVFWRTGAPPDRGGDQ